MRLYKIHVSTHIIQPFDKTLVAPFKREYRKIQSSLNNDVSNVIISASRSFEKSFPSDAIINAFAVTGLQPIQVARCLNDKHHIIISMILNSRRGHPKAIDYTPLLY